MNYTSLISAYKTLVNQLVGAKVSENSIDPTDVAAIGIELADLLLPILNEINDFLITGGTLPPSDVNGQDLDLYIQGGTSLVFWRKRNGVWVSEASVPLGIQIVDGNITLQASVNGQVVTVSAGTWSINNIIYSKGVQTQLNLSTADLNFNRIDTIIANSSNSILLLNGVASSNPTPATLPSNSIVVAYVYVPSSSSGDLPYISDSNTSPESNIDDAIVSFVKTWSSYKINRMPQPWSSDPTPIYGRRWFEINDVIYDFYSLVDNNTSEPTLNTTPEPAWSQVIENGSPSVGYQDSWDAVTSFNNGVIVEFFSAGQNRLYRSLQGSNLNQNPSSSPLYWEEIGIMRGEYPDDQPYDEGDVALNPGDNILYQSNVANNSFALDYELPGGTWQLIGGGVSEIPTLQQVLEVGNISTQPLRLGNDSRNVTFSYDSENGRGVIRLIDDSDVVSEFLIQTEDTENPGFVIDKRLGIQDATQPGEAITLGQATGLIGNDGSYSVADTGQSTILIPHGLTGTPTYYNIFAPGLNTRNLMNSTAWSADGTNLIGSPDFLNNDGETLTILWTAKL